MLAFFIDGSHTNGQARIDKSVRVGHTPDIVRIATRKDVDNSLAVPSFQDALHQNLVGFWRQGMILATDVNIQKFGTRQGILRVMIRTVIVNGRHARHVTTIIVGRVILQDDETGSIAHLTGRGGMGGIKETVASVVVVGLQPPPSMAMAMSMPRDKIEIGTDFGAPRIAADIHVRF